jgi:hypothetical protein
MFSHLSHFLGNSVICICCFTYADESAKMWNGSFHFFIVFTFWLKWFFFK